MWLLLPLRQTPLGEESSTRERWLLEYGKGLSTRILVALPSVLSPEPAAPDSPDASLVHSVLPLTESRVSGCKQNFVSWPFKSLSVSSAHLSLVDRNSAAFQS